MGVDRVTICLPVKVMNLRKAPIRVRIVVKSVMQALGLVRI